MTLRATAQSGILETGGAAQMARGVTTSIGSIASNAYTEPRKLDDSDAPGSIYAPGTGLRALWTEWSVEVRVLSGAPEKPRYGSAGLFLFSKPRLGRQL